MRSILDFLPDHHRVCTVILGLLPSLCVSLSTTVGARTFPDTNDGIFVFADQIPPGNTTAQNEFAATHYVGTQKMIRDDIRAIRAFNPDFLHLHYKLSVGAGDSTIYFVDGNEWVTDWGYVSQQDDWFVTTDEGDRIRHLVWSWYLMDVSGAIGGAGNAGWKEYWADTCIEQMRNNEADGVFADSYDVAVVNAIYLDPPYWWFEGTNPAEYWVPHLDVFGSYITERVHAEPEQFYMLPNLGYQVTSWDPADYAFSDGGMIEGFGQWGADNPFDLSDWKLQMDRILELIGLGKIMILQSYTGDPLDYDDRGFYLGCYLLIKGHKTFLNILADGPGLNMQYYPEYEVDLGPFSGEPPSGIDDLFDPEAGIYRRSYEKGSVLVNPTSNPKSIALGRPGYRVVPIGGGLVDESGDFGGSLSYLEVDQFVLPPFEAVVVLDSLPTVSNQASGLVADHRGGQTFLTWSEIEGTGEVYNVYRHGSIITEGNLQEAERIAEIPHGSAYYANEMERQNPIQRNFIIEDLGPELSDGTGLLVWTPNLVGESYYAVTVVVGGIENTQIDSGNSLQEPVVETDDPPEPILVWASGTGRGWVFTQFMDYAAWNPSFDGYAYNYGVGVPTNYDGETPFSLTTYLDGWGTRYQTLSGAPYDYQTIYVSIDDPHQTWYYGHAAEHDYRDGNIPTAGRIANFTEWRILRAIDDLVRDPDFLVDEARIYAYGGSMGGSGALTLGLRYPDVYAAVFGAAPMTDYETSGDYGGADWEQDLDDKWGIEADNLPICNLGAYASDLVQYDGLGVWDWMDHQQNMVDRIADETSFLSTTHGDADDVIEWESQGSPWYQIMDTMARRGFAGSVVAGGGHYWYGFGGCGPNLPFESFVFRKDRSFPGMTDCSLNTGNLYNHALEWSCPWNNFAGDIVDTSERYEIVLRVVDNPNLPNSGTVDITPRRLQGFQINPGDPYVWRNEDLEGAVVAEGVILADSFGLLLVDDLEVSKQGNRLVLEPDTATSSGDAIRQGRFRLEQPHPNPFYASTRIGFTLPSSDRIVVEVYDIHGRRVRKWLKTETGPGRDSIEWDGRDRAGRSVPAGVYMIRLLGSDSQATGSIVKIR